jgi:biotin carboxyl carrier protein
MRRYTIEVGGKQYVIEVQEVTANRYQVFVGDQAYEVRLSSDEDLAEAQITPEMLPFRASHVPQATPSTRQAAAAPPPPSAPSASAPPPPRPTADQASGALTAPMPGKILSIEVRQGERVSRGQVVVILEAMKMKNAIKSPRDGIITQIAVQPEQGVAFGDLLLQLGEE